MLHSPHLVKVQLHTEAFRRMENLKFLFVENVHIGIPLELKGKVGGIGGPFTSSLSYSICLVVYGFLFVWYTLGYVV